MRKHATLTLFMLMGLSLIGQEMLTPFEKSGETETATYEQAISWYQQLAKRYKKAHLIEYGQTDAGKPLHLFVISSIKKVNPQKLRESKQAFVLINNGIHPGEPCGIDASMMLARDILKNEEFRGILENTSIGIVPLYNIGGALNRSSYSRANQEGPVVYGFRGNARNYDLNRDFLKMDTRNAHAFVELFQDWLPHLFVDTHTTNGADYQATMTLIPSRPEKLPKASADIQKRASEKIKKALEKTPYKVCPYVYSVADVPNKGIAGFLDLPRYSSGYASLFATPSFITETHMLKPFKDRVWVTYHSLKAIMPTTAKESEELKETIDNQRFKAWTTWEKHQEGMDNEKGIPINWALDRKTVDSLEFEGFAYSYEKSEVTGLKRLKYHRDQPETFTIPFYNTFYPAQSIQAPNAYIIPQAYHHVIERLKANKVEMSVLSQDMDIEVEAYYIDKLHTQSRAYEGHYYHDSVSVTSEEFKVKFYAGDVVVPVNQWRYMYLVHALEPEAADALFRWNAFDGILMQKEYFSSYVFEERAKELLESDPALKAAFEKEKEENERFSKSGRAQLDFIYRRSPHYEKTHRRYPVFRLMEQVSLPLSQE
ncbi:MAG: M14 family zinc carboxypeptidase [Bacteroidota bacterium]